MLQQINMENLLKNKNIRVTPFRMDVLRVFNSFENAISLSQIEEKLGSFDRITLYRTLKSFQENGLIHEIVMPGDIKKFAMCEEKCGHKEHDHQHEHIHFHCKKCSEVYCLDVPALPDFHFTNYTIENVEIQVKGICEKCKF